MKKLTKEGITVEWGPANSPQTNGLAKRFNFTLLVKMRCILAQSNVPVTLWDEAARYSSTLLKILLAHILDYESPLNVLQKSNQTIEPTRDIHSLLPFGIQTYVKVLSHSKIMPAGVPLLYLGFEEIKDGVWRDIRNGIQRGG